MRVEEITARGGNSDTGEKIRIVVVAAYPAIRAGLHILLAESPRCIVVDSVGSPSELSGRWAQLRPTVLLLDAIGGEGGTTDPSLSALLRLVNKEYSQRAAVVVLGEEPVGDLPLLSNANLPGYGYLLREADGAQIAQAVEAADAGLIVLDRSLPVLLPGEMPEASPIGLPHTSDGTLTPREIEVLQIMARGLPNKSIAFDLGISLHTVKFHVAQILAKLGATSRTEAVTMGARRGMILL